MGLLSYIKGLVKDARAGKVISAIIDANRHGRMDWGDASKPDGQQLLRSYENTVYACCNIIASTLADIEFKVMVAKRKSQKLKTHTKPVSERTKKFLFETAAFRTHTKAADDVEEIVDRDNGLVRLLREINPFWNRYEFYEAWSTYSDLVGKFPFHKVKESTFGMVTQLWPLEPTRLRPVMDQREFIKEWKYLVSGEPVTFSTDEIVYHRRFHPLHPVDGYAPLRGSWRASRINNKLFEHEEHLLNNRAMPELMAMVEGQVDKDKGRRLNEQFADRYGGSNFGGVGFFGGNIRELKEVGFSPKDMQYMDALKASREFVCNGFGVPIALLTSENSNQATHHASMIQLMRFGVRPRATRIVETLNQQLVPDFDNTGQMFIAFDDPVQEDELEKMQVLTGYVGSKPIMTQNEARKELNLDEVDDESANDLATPMPSFGGFGGAENNNGKPPQNGTNNKPNKAIRKFKADAGDAPVARGFQTTVNDLFEKQRQWVMSFQDKDESTDRLFFQIADFVQFWQDKSEAAYQPFIAAMHVYGSTKGRDVLGTGGIAFDISQREAIAYLETRGKQLLERIVRDVNAKTAGKLRDAIRDGIEAGEPIAEVRKRVDAVFDGGKARSKRISRTETKRALEAGRKDSYRAAGVQQVQWLASDPCEFCSTLDGTIINIDQNFTNKSDGILQGDNDGEMDVSFIDTPHPPAHPNCRCVLLPVV